MSATLVAEDLAAGHGDRVLFSGLDLVVAPGDVVGLVGANGAGKSTLLRTARRPGHARRRAASRLSPPTATRRLPAAGARAAAGRDGARSSWPAAPASPRRRRALDAATEALVDGRAGRRRRLRATRWSAGSPSAAPTWTSAPRRWPPTSGWRVDLDRPMTALSGGQAARAGLAALLLSPLRRLPARRADQRPRPGRPGAAGAVRRRAARAGIGLVSHDREFLARTVDPRGRARPRPAAGPRATAAATRPTCDEREVARRHAREEYEEYADTKAGLEARARMQRAWMEKGVRNAGARRQDNDKIGRKARAEADREAGREGPADRAADRAAGRGRGAAQGVGAADGDRRRAARRRGRGRRCAARWCGAATSPSARSTCRSTGPTGSRSPAPTARASRRCWRALLGRVPLDEGTRRSGSGVVVGEVDQARGLFLGERARCCDAFGAAVPDWPTGRRPHAAGQVRARRPSTCCARPPPCRPASAPAPRWPCCRRAA